MTKLNKLACLLVIAIASVASAENASIKIVKETKIFALDKSRDISENEGLQQIARCLGGMACSSVPVPPTESHRESHIPAMQPCRAL